VVVQLDLKPVEARLSIRESVERALSALIVSGELAPGTLVSVPTLAAQFDVSATPVREAMLELERRGFVEAVKNKGFRVTEVSDEELAHIVEVRQLLEPPAMHRLAQSFPHERLDELTASAQDIIAGAEHGDLRAYLEADVAFHLTLTAMLGNPLLVQMVSELRSRTRLIGLTALTETGRLTESAAEHLDLLQALSAGDAEAARRVMSHHISHILGSWSGHPEGPSEPDPVD